ncbi:SNF2 family N-terminal domain-containing protein [Talaromyces proteolyticus]|uniref:SNF2 family N-terminal domain-containing protein n=1 Tax=Talaromyces proteolyticus TaxID=1131652 RepID=A0AAD4PVR1_9EURO|nr:SNF2 family N-terminal domain-containing protein [Talaromyces proteolyticus]KAH8690625.1 SNF2 family N-terminal domain-containing protein [Talaromyces proteolyticus]
MEFGLPQAPNKRRCLDVSVASLLNPTSIVASEHAGRIIVEDEKQNNEETEHYSISFNLYPADTVGNIEHIPPTGFLNGVQGSSQRTGAVHGFHPIQQSLHYHNQHYLSTSFPQNNFEETSTNKMLGELPTGFENHTSATVNQNHRPEAVQGEAIAFANCDLHYKAYNQQEFEEPPALVDDSLSHQHQASSMFAFNPVAIEVTSKASLLSLSRTIAEIPVPVPNSIDKEHHIHVGETAKNKKTTVCFGMFAGITGEFEVSLAHNDRPFSSPVPIRLETADSFTCPSIGRLQGTVSTQHRQLLQAILDESSIRIQATCTWDEKNMDAQSLSSVIPRLISCILSFTLYGPMELCEELGTFFQDYEIYLQDPLNCDLNVTYCNPHRLSSTDIETCPMTFRLQTDILEAFDVRAIPHQSELLDIMDRQEDLPEASQPSIIHAQLERHQKQALSFMLRREQGWAFGSSSGDLWGWKRTGQGRLFLNMISGDHQREEPKQFFGGIIADPMGLGKTLTMIALVASDLQIHNVGNATLDKRTYNFGTNKTTLIVVPPALLDTWEEQLSQHVVPGGLAWYRHHGKARLVDVFELEKLNIILTTYHTISTEWKNSSKSDSSILFSTQWKRLILDEAHFIRNSNSQMAKAVCSIRASRRWAVTGTPIQNRLGDLAALLKFLDVYPYCDAKHFDADITHLWKTGESEKAMERLKRLSRCLILRRPKTTINLPTRTDLRCLVNFTTDERELYEKIKSKAIAHFVEAVRHEGAEGLPSLAFVNIIQQINALRMVCDMGMHYNSRYDVRAIENNDPSEATDWSSVAQQTFNFQCEIASITCQLCKSMLDITERLFGGSSNHLTNPLFSQCWQFVCPDCVQRSHEDCAKDFLCGHSPPHPFAPVSLNRDILEDGILMPAQSTPGSDVMLNRLPSKVTSLLRRLKSQPFDSKSIVFSTWRMTLDVVEAGLDKAQIQCLRYDGKVPQKERKNILDRFRRDPSISVLLLTLSCGAVGLTLTEASYAYLMEPHWNPTVEEQALARIHRLGQKNEVTTIRFYVKDTFEERVMEVQRSKEDLAGILFSSDNGNIQSGNKARLERLCSLL